jgi:hypothetical protein
VYVKNTKIMHCCFSMATMITRTRHNVTLSCWHSATSLHLPGTQLFIAMFPSQNLLRTCRMNNSCPVASATHYFLFPRWPKWLWGPHSPLTAYDNLSQAEQLLGNWFYRFHISLKLRMRGAVPSFPIVLRDIFHIRTFATPLYFIAALHIFSNLSFVYCQCW